MGTFESFRKAYGALKDSTMVGLAKVNSEYKDLDIAIVKATNHVECPPKELALVTAPSNNTQSPVESKLAGGFDRLLLDSLYEDDAARRQIQLQYAGYGPGSTSMVPSSNPFDQPDPFTMSNNIAPPTNVQIAYLAQQQQQLMFQQQQYYQNQQQNMMMVPYGVHQQSYQRQPSPTYGTQIMHHQQMVSSNPFGDPFPGFSQQQRPVQPHENPHLL